METMDNALETQFGPFLKEFRLRSKMTQKDLSEKIGVSPQTLLKWEKMESFPSRNTLMKKLAGKLQIPFQEFKHADPAEANG